MTKNKKIDTLSLFSWCWGMDLWFEMAWINIDMSNDIVNSACETLRKNFNNTEVLESDITLDETKEKIYNYFKNSWLDLIIWWPPCQAYSMAWKRDFCDRRGRLFEDYIKIVEKLKPKICIMENVKGILSIKHLKQNLSNEELEKVFKLTDKIKETKDKKEKCILNKELNNYKEPVLNQVINSFNEAWYDVEYKVLISADYWVAQKRERVIFIAKRKDIKKKCFFPEPILKQENYKTVYEAINNLKELEEDKEFWQIYTKHSDEFLEKIKNTPIWKSVLGTYSDAFFRAYPNLPSRTVKENHWGVFVHYEKNRVMTPRELARLQSFPDDFIITWTKSKMLVQIWNAVPPLMAKSIGLEVIKFFKK